MNVKCRLSVAVMALVGIGHIPACAQESTRPQIDDVRWALSVLADDSLAGRRAGTPGSFKAAAFIAAQLESFGVEAAGDSGYFQRVPMVGVEQNGRRRVGLLPSWSDLDTVPRERRLGDVNVVGVLWGGDPALRDEVVIIGAHHDHVGVRQPVDGDSIYNGADDDASGVVAVLEIARALASGPRPKRTVVFLFSTAEEMGLVGTRWYMQHPVVPLEQTVADFQVEMIGRPDSLAGGPGRAWLTGYERSTMGDMLRDAGNPIVPDPRPDQNFYMRSDNIPFAMAGIPAHTLSSFNLHSDYHRPSDEVELVDFEHVTMVIEASIQAARLLANGEKPEWHPGGRPEPRRR
jgi:hypothetical protein